jgi:hypothetical protein
VPQPGQDDAGESLVDLEQVDVAGRQARLPQRALAILSSDVSARTPSSCLTSSNGVISAAKRPSSCAAAARWWLRSANSSRSERSKPKSRAIVSADRNCEIS